MPVFNWQPGTALQQALDGQRRDALLSPPGRSNEVSEANNDRDANLQPSSSQAPSKAPNLAPAQLSDHPSKLAGNAGTTKPDQNPGDQIEMESNLDEEIAFVIPKPKPAVRPNANLPRDVNQGTPDIPIFEVPTPRIARRLTQPLPGNRRPASRAHTKLAMIQSAPFPYSGTMPGSGRPFLNVLEDGRRGHRTGSGRIYWADQTYNDRRSLLHIPEKFDIDMPGVIVLFFHGHGAMLERDVWRRQRLPAQVSLSGMNAVLVAPQFARDARDSSIGAFWRPGHVDRYLDDVARELARTYGDPQTAGKFANMPIVIVGYSGGFLPTAYALAQGGIADRIRGVVLLDALYGQLGTFSKWIRQSREVFFVSAHARSTERGHNRLVQKLNDNGIAFQTELPDTLTGGVVLISAPANHRNYVTRAWIDNPVSDVLRRIKGLARRPGANRYVVGAAN